MSRKLLMNNSSGGLMPVQDGLICWLDGRDGITNNDRLSNNISISNTITDNNCFIADKSMIITEDIVSSVFNCTVELFIKREELDHWGRIMSFYSNGYEKTLTFLNSTGNQNDKIRWYDFEKPNPFVISSIPVKNNYFHHVVINTNTFMVYIDGVNVTTNHGITSYNSDIQSISIFASKNNTNHIKCKLGSFRIYNRQLTETEIKQNYEYEQSIQRGI